MPTIMAVRRGATLMALHIANQMSSRSAWHVNLAPAACCGLCRQSMPHLHVPDTWYLQLERLASLYTAAVSAQQQACSVDCTDPEHEHEQRQPLTFEQQEQECWGCHDKYHRGGLVCRSCDRIQPVDTSLTYFDLMGYRQPTFDLDPAALEKRYKLLQWQLHPDKAGQKSPQEQEYSAEQASLINQAYGVLRNPLSRANYLLMLQGLTDKEHEGTIDDPELLMEVMEARELVDQEDDQGRLVKLHSTNKQRQAALCAELSIAFEKGAIEVAKQLVAQLSYWVRLEEAICEKL